MMYHQDLNDTEKEWMAKNKFKTIDHMKYNSNKEQNQGSYKCELCGATFPSRRDREEHMHYMHGI